jgi:hypothetical protein
MHDYDDIYYSLSGPVNNCWYCGQRGQLHCGGPFMICRVCDVMWTRWERPASTVTYAPMYETVLSRCGRRGTAHPLCHLRGIVN